MIRAMKSVAVMKPTSGMAKRCKTEEKEFRNEVSDFIDSRG